MNNTTDVSPDPELEKLAFDLDPYRVPLPKHQLIWALIVAFFLVIAVAVAATIGVMRSGSRPGTSAVNVPTTARGVFVSSTVSETLLILVGWPGAYSDITVASTTADTVQIKGLPQDSLRVLSAALSPQADRVVYIHEKNAHRFVSVSDLVTGHLDTLATEALEEGAWGKSVEPCSWSSVAWSPDGNRFSLFVCENKASTLAVVEATTELSPVLLANTRSSSVLPRQAFWLDNDSLVYTHPDSRSDQVLVSRIAADEDAKPLHVYGR